MLRRALLGLPSLLILAGPALAAAPPAPKGGGGNQQASFVRLPVFTANIVRSNRTRGVMSVESGVDVPDPKLRTRISLLTPRLRSDLSRRLALYTSNLAPGAPPDLDLLVPLLQKQVDTTAGQAGARLLVLNVLIN
jgi:hypothetical protein